MKTFVILLRGVMPTGKNRVPMAPLREALAEAGLGGVRTYIQSGNVIAESDLSGSEVERLVHEVIHAELGATISVVARSAREFTSVFERCPFESIRSPTLYFSLLASKPDRERVGQFATIDFSPDEVCLSGSTIYTRYATKHSDSRFNNNYFERKLEVAATTRNYNTMSRLVALAAQQDAVPDRSRARRARSR